MWNNLFNNNYFRQDKKYFDDLSDEFVDKDYPSYYEKENYYTNNRNSNTVNNYRPLNYGFTVEKQKEKMPKCLVLDMDETLVHTIEDGEKSDLLDVFNVPEAYSERKRLYWHCIDNVLDQQEYEDETEEFIGLMRPGCQDFLSWCQNNFDTVVIWSAGQRKYVHSIVGTLFQDLKSPDLVWTYDDCEKSTDEEGYEILKKPLRKLIKHFSDPNINLTNTFIVDDNPNYILAEEKANHRLIVPYDPVISVKGLKQDQELFKLENLFSSDHFYYTADVRNSLNN